MLQPVRRRALAAWRVSSPPRQQVRACVQCFDSRDRSNILTSVHLCGYGMLVWRQEGMVERLMPCARLCHTACRAGSCTLCAVGRYSSTAVASSCTDCPAGKFGSTQGLSVATCSGDCMAGYACPAASTASNAAVNVCPAGRYSLAGASVCIDCPAGVVGVHFGCEGYDNAA
jgi:hypothetical protein